ncbi:MAG: hypothetical protein M3534_14830 [Actinomycetota bacterium]|jgi:hypothetical protein|nr:hypothetical protein [Actinomycetota bacterium]
MSDRFYSRLAWSLFALALLILASGLILWSPDASFFLAFALIAAPFAVVGALVASRRPRNTIGWLFLAFAVVAAFVASADRYASYALVEHPGSLPGGDWVAWLASGIWHPAFGFFVFAFLLFPDGRLPSARWRPVAWIAAANYLMGGVLGLLWGPLFGEFFPYVEPPFRLPSYLIAFVAFDVFLICNFALLALSAISLVLRLRRAAGVERQQLKWFVYAVALFALVFPPGVFFLGDGRLIVVLLPLVPAAAGIAILKHRLYDIDVVINRTLVYGTLTATLALIYVGGIVGLQYVFRALAGQESQLAIVASTLAIAALFRPLRRRLQDFVDRRFYRSKYDAARTLEAFSAKLRDKTGLEDLTGELVGVAQQTVQPEHVSLWLRAAREEAAWERER